MMTTINVGIKVFLSFMSFIDLNLNMYIESILLIAISGHSTQSKSHYIIILLRHTLHSRQCTQVMQYMHYTSVYVYNKSKFGRGT